MANVNTKTCVKFQKINKTFHLELESTEFFAYFSPYKHIEAKTPKTIKLYFCVVYSKRRSTKLRPPPNFAHQNELISDDFNEYDFSVEKSKTDCIYFTLRKKSSSLGIYRRFYAVH